MVPATFRPFILATSLLALTTCSSSKKDDPIIQPLNTDGLDWTVDGATSSTHIYIAGRQNTNSFISVIGKLNVNVSTTSSQLMLDIPPAVGTYTFGPTTPATATYIASTNNKSKVYFAGADARKILIGSGTIVVTELTNTRIKGTFAFTGIDQIIQETKSITSGTFNVGL